MEGAAGKAKKFGRSRLSRIAHVGGVQVEIPAEVTMHAVNRHLPGFRKGAIKQENTPFPAHVRTPSDVVVECQDALRRLDPEFRALKQQGKHPNDSKFTRYPEVNGQYYKFVVESGRVKQFTPYERRNVPRKK